MWTDCVVQGAGRGEGAGPGPCSEQQKLQEKQAEAKGKHIGTNTMGMVLDLLCFCVQHHGYRSADNIFCCRRVSDMCRCAWGFCPSILPSELLCVLQHCYRSADYIFIDNVSATLLFCLGLLPQSCDFALVAFMYSML